MPSLSHQLLENSQCDVSLLLHGTQITSSSRFSFNGDTQFAAWYQPFSDTGTYLLVVQYVADDTVRARFASSHVDMPATSGEAAFYAVITPDSATDSLIFTDLGNAAGHLTRVELFKITS